MDEKSNDYHYCDVTMKNNIIIGFSRPKGGFEPFAWLIELATKSPRAHAYIRFYSLEYKKWIIFQASGLKLNFVGNKLFDSKEEIQGEFNIPVSIRTKNRTIRFAIDNVGIPYGIGQVIGFGWVLLMRAFGKKVKNPFYSKSSYFCSELAAEILTEILDPKDKIDPSTMSPQDLYEYLISKGFKLL